MDCKYIYGSIKCLLYLEVDVKLKFQEENMTIECNFKYMGVRLF